METALATQTEVEHMGQSDLELLEEQYTALQDSIRDLDQEAWREMKALDNKQAASNFDPIRYKDRKRKLQDQLPILETRLRRERIRVLQERRAQKQQELQDLQPELLKTKAVYHEALELLEKAWKAHALLEIRAYNMEEGQRIDFDDLRSNQRALQDLIKEITGIDHDDGLSANEQNLLIRN